MTYDVLVKYKCMLQEVLEDLTVMLRGDSFQAIIAK